MTPPEHSPRPAYTLRSGDELIRRYTRSGEPTRFEQSTIEPFLRWDQVRNMRTGKTETEWAAYSLPYTIDQVWESAVAYLDYAWMVALRHCNVESQRSVIKLNAYCWMLGAEFRDFFAGTEGVYSVGGLARASVFLARPYPPSHYREHVDSKPVPLTPTQLGMLQRMMNNEPCTLLCPNCAWDLAQ